MVASKDSCCWTPAGACPLNQLLDFVPQRKHSWVCVQVVANEQLASGLSHVYNLALATKLRKVTAQHAALFRGHPPPAGWDVDAALGARTIADYDRAITIHCFGMH